MLDYGSVVIHLFDAETRQFYSLENLWADAKPVDLTGYVDADLAQDSSESGSSE